MTASEFELGVRAVIALERLADALELIAIPRESRSLTVDHERLAATLTAAGEGKRVGGKTT